MTIEDREKYFMRWVSLARLYAAVDLLGKVYVDACGTTDETKKKVIRQIYAWIEHIERMDNAEKFDPELPQTRR